MAHRHRCRRTGGWPYCSAGIVLLFVSVFMKPATAPAGGAGYLPRSVLLTTLAIAAVLMSAVLPWPTGTFIMFEQ